MTAPRENEICILHVIETLDVGGAEAVVANMVNHASPGFRTDICCLMRSGPIAARIRPGVEIIEMGKAMEGNDYRLPFRLARVLRSRNIDIVQSHDWGTLLEAVAAATLAGTKAIHMAHGPLNQYSPADSRASLKRRIRQKAERLASLKLSRVIAVSDIVRRGLVEDVGIPAGMISLIHNGIDLSVAPPGDLEAKRKELGLLPDDVVLVSVGRLAEIKNYSLLLEALARAAREVPALKLVMVGDGPERSRLEAAATRLELSGRVHFLGARGDVRDWLALGHIFVLPSLYEGVSLALLEAMAAGLPAVVTRVGGNPEVVMDGECGFLIESGDTEGFARALVTLAREGDLRVRMGRAARARIEAEFDLKKAVKQYEEIYLRSVRRAGD
jgi:glycosyltransferase involved in cell wall biosynthesis